MADGHISQIAVLMTSFNRRAKTLNALTSLSKQSRSLPYELHTFLVDDASSDGTVDAVKQEFPNVTVISGTGSLYWNGGMRLAFCQALQADFDAYLWLNDDTDLFPNALETLLSTEQSLRREGVTAIVTGSTCDASTGERTYGGLRRVNKTFYFGHEHLEPSRDYPLSCDSMNGNCTLIPRIIALRLGNLEERFQHHFGDIDYGYRAKKAGFSVYVAPGYLGTCASNSTSGTWRDRTISMQHRWKDILSIKGYRFPEWLLFCKRHYGYLWFIQFLIPYVKASLPRIVRNS